MRALTGYDRVTLVCGGSRSESSRGAFAAPADVAADLPAIVADSQPDAIAIFPRDADETSAPDALLCAPGTGALNSLGASGVRSAMRVPFSVDDLHGEFRCESRTPREPNFELHAAAELFAQLFAMRLEIDQLKNG